MVCSPGIELEEEPRYLLDTEMPEFIRDNSQQAAVDSVNNLSVAVMDILG